MGEIILSIDVCIPTKDSSKTIERCLDSLLIAGIPIKKLIIVDASKDNTKDIISKWCYNNNIYFIILNQIGVGVGLARQIALDNVETSIFASVDSDVILTEGWYNKIVDYMILDYVVVASGFLYFGNKGNAMYKFLDWKRRSYIFHLSLGNCLINTDKIKLLGGFNNTYNACEDTELYEEKVLKSDYKWILDRNIIAYNPRGLIDELNHSFWYGKYYHGGLLRAIMRVGASVIYGTQIMITEHHYDVFFYLPTRMFVWLMGLVYGKIIRFFE
jgi:glycosyltransferase involved in cell wall biosynthesis